MRAPNQFADTTDRVDAPTQQPGQAAPAVEASATEVLITTSEVVFSTATALGARRATIGERLSAVMRRIFANSPDRPHPRPQHYPNHYAFIEQSLMEREMHRL